MRRTPIRRSRGTTIPPLLRIRVLERDGGCVGFGRFPGDCLGALQIDHVRASGGLGMKSPTEEWNLTALCLAHHEWKTAHGREARPQLIAYLEVAS